MRKLLSTLKKRLSVFKPTVSPLDTMPDFQNFQYCLATEPSGSRIRAWSKLRECERRLEMYKWVVSLNDPRKAQHRILLNDTVSAFLLSFEATIQFVADQLPRPASEFGNWIAGQPPYDVTLRGLRTLRHFEAHVESKTLPSRIKVNLSSHAEPSRTWHLPALQQNDLAKLDHSPLKAAHLSDWNNLISQTDAVDVFADGIRRLGAILCTAQDFV